MQQHALQALRFGNAVVRQHAIRVHCSDRVISVKFTGPAITAWRKNPSWIGLHEQRPVNRISGGCVFRRRSRRRIEGTDPVEIGLAQEVSLEDCGHVIRRCDIAVQSARERAELGDGGRDRHARPEGRARVEPHVVLAVARDGRERSSLNGVRVVPECGSVDQRKPSWCDSHSTCANGSTKVESPRSILPVKTSPASVICSCWIDSTCSSSFSEDVSTTVFLTWKTPNATIATRHAESTTPVSPYITTSWKRMSLLRQHAQHPGAMSGVARKACLQ